MTVEVRRMVTVMENPKVLLDEVWPNSLVLHLGFCFVRLSNPD